MEFFKKVIGILTLINLLCVPLNIYQAITYSTLFPLLPAAFNTFVVYNNWNYLTGLFKKEPNEINIG